jgi:hypothetical protein
MCMAAKRYIVAFLAVATSMFAALPLSAQEDGTPLILQTHERSGYIMGHTRGMGFGYQQGRIMSIRSTLFWHTEFATLKHAKEYRRTNESFPNTRTYSYGKLNRVYMLRGGLGMHRNLADKPYWGGVQVKYSLFGGINLSLAEPIYLYILYYNVQEGAFYRNLEPYDPDKHFADHIYGRGPLWRGLKEAKIYPGVYMKGSFHFDYGSDGNYVRALEVGGAVDLFPKKIPIMAFTRNNHLHITLFLALHFGERK